MSVSVRAIKQVPCPQQVPCIAKTQVSARQRVNTLKNTLIKRYLGIIDTGSCEATSEGGCQPFFVPTGCFSHMA